MFHRPNKTAGAKRGLIETSAYDALLPYVAGPDEPPRYALHFGTVDKVGINPRSEHDTPLAVCAYPLTEEIFEQFLRIELPFAQRGAIYLYLLEIRPEARVFYSTKRFFKQGVGPEYVRSAAQSRKFFYSTRPKDYEDAPKYASEEYQTVAKAAQWGRKLMDMGIAVWVDADNEGILHGNEPSQVMFFSPLSYSTVLSMSNPKNKREAKYGRDWRRREDLRGAKPKGAKPKGAKPKGSKSIPKKLVEKIGKTNVVNQVYEGIATDLTGADLRGVDLRGVDLRGMDLRGANLIEADLTGADLRGADLIDAKLIEADLRGGAKLNGAKLNGANLEDAKLEDANLTGANLTDANLTDADLTDANLTDVNLTDANLTDADLTGANLTGANLTGANLVGKNLWAIKLTDANLTDANLTDAKLPYAKLKNANLRGADLTGANLKGAYLKNVKYNTLTVWPDSVRDVLRMWRGDKDLTDVDLTHADLEEANLTGADLTSADLTGAKLRSADLTGAILTDAKLRSADLRYAILSDTNLEDIDYDEDTIWPDGFTPPFLTIRRNRRR
jgi:uncharacterized protein YjbI with pentapeptide repeats